MDRIDRTGRIVETPVEIPEAGPGPSPPGRSGSTWLLLIVVLAVVVLGYLTVSRISSLEENIVTRLDEVDEQLEIVGERAEQAVASATTAEQAAGVALGRATTAEESAAEAALLRENAERARELAEAETESARAALATAAGEAERVRAELDRIEQERQAELDRLERALGSLVETRRTALGLVMSLGSDAIEFAFDSAELQGKDRELLSRIAGVLLTSTGYSVAVYGHTDDVGTAEYNRLLSERRADAVRDYLVEAGVGSEIISTRGYGQTSPRIAESTPEARARNRRVEIAIIDVAIQPARVLN
jgi:outer membrane protein OmpA-like peptidoglycan-associated protein